MPLEKRYTELPMRGLDERSDDRSVSPGRLTVAQNCDFQPGAVTKRRGYERLAVQGAELLSSTVDEHLHRVGIYRDELLIFGHSRLYAVAEKDAGMYPGPARSIVERGWLPRCSLSIQDIASSQSVADPEDPPPG